MDLLVQGRDEILRRTYVEPPSGYKARLVVQISLCSFLILQCCMYLFIWIRDARARGKSLQMFKLEKTQGGRMITVQSLYAYVWGSLLTAIILLASRVFLLKTYYLSGSNENARVWNLFALTPAVLGVLVYTFSNFKAALLLARKDTIALWSSLNTTWVMVHNFLFVGSIVAWLGSSLPLSLQTHAALKDVDSLTSETLSLLNRIIDDPAQMTASNFLRLQTLQTALMSGADRINNRILCCLGVGVLYCAFFALSGCLSLGFVYNLRKHLHSMSKGMSKGPMSSGDDSVEMSTQSSSSGPGLHSALQYHTRPSTNLGRVTNEARKYDPDRNALQKLVSDLTLSVPLVLIMSIYYPVAGGLAIKWGAEPIWGWREFTQDILFWPVVALNNIILGFFIFNGWKRSGRYGAGSDRSSDSNHSRSLTGSTHLPPMAWEVPQGDSRGTGQNFSEGLYPHIVHISVKEVAKGDM